jgi:hypothetical protein
MPGIAALSPNSLRPRMIRFLASTFSSLASAELAVLAVLDHQEPLQRTKQLLGG